MNFEHRSLDELEHLVRSYGCVRALHAVVEHGPSTVQPGVQPHHLDTLTYLGLCRPNGEATPRGRELSETMRSSQSPDRGGT